MQSLPAPMSSNSPAAAGSKAKSSSRPMLKKRPSSIELAAGGRLTIPRSQVARVDATSDAEAEYQKLARSSPDTVDAHWKLAEWCREHKLPTEGQRHLERILELDPNHAEARTALGFRQKDGQWMNRDDVMASRGLVLYEGRYVTPQQVELMEQQKKSRVTQADWTNRIEQLRRWLTGRRQDQVGPGPRRNPGDQRSAGGRCHCRRAPPRKRSRPQAAVDRSRVPLEQSRRGRRAGQPVAHRSGRRNSPPVPGIPDQIRPPRPGDAVHPRAQATKTTKSSTGPAPRSAKSATATRSARSSTP